LVYESEPVIIMSYKPSPRPTFSAPTYIPYASVTRHLWGDVESGEVADWIYVSSDSIHQLVFGLAPGGAFRHSDAYRTIFAADLVYYVISGSMVICNPQTGETYPAHAGDAAFFRRDTWHHVFNHSTEPLRVLEFFAPPPSKGTAGSYARQQPYLSTLRYAREDLYGHFPMMSPMQNNGLQQTIRIMHAQNRLYRMEGAEQQILTGLIAATEHLTSGVSSLLPGKPTEPHSHTGDESLYVLEGSLNIHLPDTDGQRFFELHPGDGFYIPSGIAHRYLNMTANMVKWVFGIAPGIVPVAAK
jgi:quercetin dioxygenase-like cupin family protein